ncbi:macro domain-containing protein [Nostoc sp. UHCC 0702]|nr:macro domain-containing protein [Nostoc sp. UHCC 0702]
MSVIFKSGNVLEDKAQALVNPVNCVGVMGKGLALAFKEKYPEYSRDYKEYCDDGMMSVGSCHLWYPDGDKPIIVSFPTKIHWAGSSRIEYIEDGLKNLGEIISRFDINSIAIPALGCGEGGLSWDAVKPMIFNWAIHHQQSTGLNTTIYTPFQS